MTAGTRAPDAQDTDQIERIGGRHDNLVTIALTGPRLAQQRNGLGQGELLAAQTGNEAATADLATCLEPPIHAQQLAPWRQPRRLAGEQAPADDSVAAQQGACDMFGCLAIAVAVGRRQRICGRLVDRRLAGTDQRPATGVLDAKQTGSAQGTAASRATLCRRHEQGAQAGKAVGVDQAAGDQFTERLLKLDFQQVRAMRDLVEERRTVLAQMIEHSGGT